MWHLPVFRCLLWSFPVPTNNIELIAATFLGLCWKGVIGKLLDLCSEIVLNFDFFYCFWPIWLKVKVTVLTHACVILRAQSVSFSIQTSSVLVWISGCWSRINLFHMVVETMVTDRQTDGQTEGCTCSWTKDSLCIPKGDKPSTIYAAQSTMRFNSKMHSHSQWIQSLHTAVHVCVCITAFSYTHTPTHMHTRTHTYRLYTWQALLASIFMMRSLLPKTLDTPLAQWRHQALNSFAMRWFSTSRLDACVGMCIASL